MVLSSAIVCDHDRRSMFPYDRRRSQTIADLIAICDLRSAIIWRPAFMFYLLRSSAIVCDHDRRIADDRRSMFPYDRRRSQTIADLIAICDLRSAIIWKPAFRKYLRSDCRARIKYTKCPAVRNFNRISIEITINGRESI